MCDDCYDAVVEENTALEETVERYAAALNEIVKSSEYYRLFGGHLDGPTKTLVLDMSENYADIAIKALEGDDE